MPITAQNVISMTTRGFVSARYCRATDVDVIVKSFIAVEIDFSDRTWLALNQFVMPLGDGSNLFSFR